MTIKRPRVRWWMLFPTGFWLILRQLDIAEQMLERHSRRIDPHWWAKFDFASVVCICKACTKCGCNLPWKHHGAIRDRAYESR